MRRKKQKSLPFSMLWIVFAILCWLAFRLISPYYMESFYGQWLFPGIRSLFDILHGWMPFSIAWLILLWCIWLLWKKKFTGRKKKKRKGNGAFKWPERALVSVAVLVGLFYLLWGFNYKRPGLSDRLQLTTVAPDSTVLLELYYEQMDALIQLEIARRDSLVERFDYTDDIRGELEEDLEKAGYVIAGKPRVRTFFKGFLLRWGTAGFYNPWIGEGYLDPGLHPMQRPFILAHELSHAYGVTDEGEANFYALTSTLSSGHDYVRYVGHLTFIRYILSDLSYYPSQYAKAREDIAPHVLQDLRAISKQMDKYPDILPWLRDAIYSNYLKAQGVHSGLKSYNEILQNYLALRASNDHLGLLPEQTYGR